MISNVFVPVVFLLSIVSVQQSVESDATDGINCGPRCVNFVMKWYGMESNLIDVITQIEGQATSQGYSLADLGDELDRHGMHTKVVKTNSRNMVSWQEPMIAHLKSVDERGLAHFVVVLPESRDGQVVYWDGVSEVTQVSFREFLSKCSGYMLVTSKSDFELEDLTTTRIFPSYLLIGVLGALVALGIVFCNYVKVF